MSWAKVDDQLHSHDKWLDVSLAGRGLWTTVLSWVADKETDGAVPRSVVRLHAGGQWQELAGELVAAGLWEEAQDGWTFHDYLVYNRSHTELQAERDAARERMSRRRSPEVRANNAPNTPSTSAPPVPVPVPVPKPEETNCHTPQENVAPASVSQAVSGWREGEENLAAVAANLLTGCPDHWEPALIAQYRGARNVSNPAKYLGGIVTRWKQGQNAPTAPPPPKAPPPPPRPPESLRPAQAAIPAVVAVRSRLVSEAA